jgi:hypothetical protein
MPSTTDQTPGRWTEYNNANEEKIGDLKELNDTPPNNFKTITDNLILQPGELALEVANKSLQLHSTIGNSILEKGADGSSLLHNPGQRQILTHHRSSRDMKTAPLKSFYPREATANLVNPRTSGRSSTSRTHIPSIKQFLTCNSIEEFVQLNGSNKEQEKIESISNKPVMFWIHPSIFYILDGNREILATDAGMRIIESLKKNCRDERAEDSTNNRMTFREMTVSESHSSGNSAIFCHALGIESGPCGFLTVLPVVHGGAQYVSVVHALRRCGNRSEE